MSVTMGQIWHLSDLLELIELNHIHFSFYSLHIFICKYITPINIFCLHRVFKREIVKFIKSDMQLQQDEGFKIAKDTMVDENLLKDKAGIYGGLELCELPDSVRWHCRSL